MLRGRGCRTPLPLAPLSRCCSSAAAAAAACRLVVLLLLPRLWATEALLLPPTPLRSACVLLPVRLCPADTRPCCTTGNSGGSNGCLVTCRGQGSQAGGDSRQEAGIARWQQHCHIAVRAAKQPVPQSSNPTPAACLPACCALSRPVKPSRPSKLSMPSPGFQQAQHGLSRHSHPSFHPPGSQCQLPPAQPPRRPTVAGGACSQGSQGRAVWAGRGWVKGACYAALGAVSADPAVAAPQGVQPVPAEAQPRASLVGGAAPAHQ